MSSTASERTAGSDSGDLVAPDRANLCGAHGPRQLAVCEQETADGDHQADAGDLHRPDRVGSRNGVRRFRADVARLWVPKISSKVMRRACIRG